MIRASLALSLAVCGCTGTDVGNPLIDVDVVTYGELPTNQQGLFGAPRGSIEQIWVSVDRVRLRPASPACDGDAEIDLEGPFAVDTRDGEAVPGLSDIEVAEALYCRFELRWRPYDGDPAGVPSELAGASFLIEGVTAGGAPFVIRSDRSDELRLDARDAAGFPIDEATHALLVGFDVEALLAGIDLDGGEVGGDGVIRVEPGSNDDLLDAFDANLEILADLFDDNDGDGELDPDERDDTDVLAD